MDLLLAEFMIAMGVVVAPTIAVRFWPVLGTPTPYALIAVASFGLSRVAALMNFTSPADTLALVAFGSAILFLWKSLGAPAPGTGLP